MILHDLGIYSWQDVAAAGAVLAALASLGTYMSKRRDKNLIAVIDTRIALVLADTKQLNPNHGSHLADDIKVIRGYAEALAHSNVTGNYAPGHDNPTPGTRPATDTSTPESE